MGNMNLLALEQLGARHNGRPRRTKQPARRGMVASARPVRPVLGGFGQKDDQGDPTDSNFDPELPE